MRETHRRNICKPKNCDFSNWHKDSPVVISSFASFRLLWWCPSRDPFLRRKACRPPNFSRAIEECKIGLPVIKCKIHFNILMPRFQRLFVLCGLKTFFSDTTKDCILCVRLVCWLNSRSNSADYSTMLCDADKSVPGHQKHSAAAASGHRRVGICCSKNC